MLGAMQENVYNRKMRNLAQPPQTLTSENGSGGSVMPFGANSCTEQQLIRAPLIVILTTATIHEQKTKDINDHSVDSAARAPQHHLL